MNIGGIGGNLLIFCSLSFVLRPCYSLCDSQQLTEWTGVIASPGVNAGIYENYMDCEWQIKVTQGSKVKITFDLFDLEEGSTPRGSKKKVCDDYVEVNDSSGQILYECGAPVVPLEVMSSGEEVRVFFHSDESGAARGFKAVYTGVCELDIDANAVLATPGYPNSPPGGVKCSWNIHGRESQFKVIEPVASAKMLAGKSDLPECGNSPLKIQTSGRPETLTELCMKESRQAYTGEITLIYDSSSTSRTAWTGQLEIEFTDNTECNKLCAHSSGCRPVVKLSKLEFNCDCIDGYGGITCEERRDTCFGNPCLLNSSSCVEERDQVPGSEILWSKTLVKHVDTKPCPGGAVGEATRNCVHDADSSSGGFWTRPDLSLCVSQHILQILHDTQTYLQNTSKAHTDHLSNITFRLAAATNLELGSNGKWHELFPGDLSTVVDILAMVSEDANLIDTEVTADVIQEYIATVDNILDPKTSGTWRNALAGLVEAKVSKVIESMQMFISKCLPTMHGWSEQGLSVGSEGQEVNGSMTRTIFEKVVRNLGIHVVTGNLKSGLYGGFQNIAATSSVVFPGLRLNFSDSTMADVPLIIYVARFSSVSPLLSMRESRYHKDLQNDSNLINSDVLSVEVLNTSKIYFQQLREPVMLTFSLQDPSLRRHHVDKCVFMNMSASSHKDRWSTSGCKVVEYNNTHVVCHCHHLTNFAILMDVYDNQGNIDSTNKLMLAYISYIGGSLSILGCVITIIVFRYFKLESDRIRIHQQLGLSVIFVQILFICVGKTGKEYGTPLIGCRILASLLHYCLTALFCWMLVEGTHLYIVLVRVFKRGFHFKKYLLAGWGIPLLVVGISLGAFHDKYGVGNVCWLSQELLLVSFVPTVGLVVTINTVILALVIRLMIKSNNSAYKFQTQERSNLRLGVKASVVLLPLLGLTWSLGFLAVNTGQAEVMSYVFTYLFTITNSFQGVLFFIFHCLLNVDVRQAFERRYNRGKRSSYVDTTSSRLRKMSEPEVSDSNVQRVYCKDMNPVFSILDNLAPAGLRATLASPVTGPAVSMKTQGCK